MNYENFTAEALSSATLWRQMAVLKRARSSAHVAALAQVEVRKGDATSLPVATEIVDVVTTNCVINLVPEKDRAFREILRVLKPRGRLHLADISFST